VYCRGFIVAVLAFALIDEVSLPGVQYWAEQIQLSPNEMPTIFVVGNKMDLLEERRVTVTQGECVASELGCLYHELSAKKQRWY
jgi:hypothetical protein